MVRKAMLGTDRCLFFLLSSFFLLSLLSCGSLFFLIVRLEIRVLKNRVSFAACMEFGFLLDKMRYGRWLNYILLGTKRKKLR